MRNRNRGLEDEDIGLELDDSYFQSIAVAEQETKGASKDVSEENKSTAPKKARKRGGGRFGRFMQVEDEEDDSTSVADESSAVESDEEAKRLAVIDRISEGMGVQFSEAQKKVILHNGAPLNVLSCAGSGKTTVLVARNLYRELYHKIKPVNMLMITYNTKACGELQQRYREARNKLGLSRRTAMPTFKTFHALFLLLLKRVDKYKKYSVVSEGTYTLKLMNMVNSANSEKKEVLKDMLNYRSRLMNAGLSLNGVDGATFEDDINFNKDNYIAVITKYNELKEKREELDFDDMMLKLKEELENGNDDIIEGFRSVFHEVSIDEYQDISEVQRHIMDMLIGDFNRYTTIGDDDQSIYAFRGAEAKYIREFTYRYPNAVRLIMGTNYRCRSNILNPFMHSIQLNKERVEKEMNAFKDGGSLRLMPYQKTLSEAVKRIKEDTDGLTEVDLAEIGVLVRLNSQRMILADLFAEEGIAVDIGNTDFSLRENKIYKTVMGVMNAIKEESNYDFAHYCRVIFPSLHSSLFKKYEKESVTNWYEEVVVENIFNLPNDILVRVEKIKKTNNMRNIIGHIIQLSLPYYERLAKSGYGSMETTMEIFRHLMASAEGCRVSDFLKAETMKESLIRLYADSGVGLKINTLHAVKGLEYEKVYMVGVNANIFPSESHIEYLVKQGKVDKINSYIEEERRLFYVGGTRAIDELTIIYKEGNASDFVYELLDDEGVRLIDKIGSE